MCIIFQDLGFVVTKSTFWSITAATAIIVGFLFFNLAAKMRDENAVASQIKRGYGFFILFWGFTRVCFIFSDFELAQHGETLLYAVFHLTGYSVMMFGGLLLFFAIESRRLGDRKLTITKFLVAMIAILAVFWVLALINPNMIQITRYFGYGVGAIIGVGVIIFYVRLIVQSPGAVRVKVIENFIGVTFIICGHTMDAQIFGWAFQAIVWVPALISLIGTLLFYLSQRSEIPKREK